MMSDPLWEAAYALYMAGKWELSNGTTDEHQTELWKNLREALNLEPGTATKAGIHSE